MYPAAPVMRTFLLARRPGIVVEVWGVWRVWFFFFGVRLQEINMI